MRKREYLQRILIYLLLTIIIVVGTIFVVLFAKGYRFQLRQRTISVDQTGVLYIRPNPLRANFEVLQYGQLIKEGKTPDTVTSLKQGVADVRVFKDGYYDWHGEVLIKSGWSSPIYPVLFFKKPQIEESRELEGFRDGIRVDGESHKLFVHIQEKTPSAPASNVKHIYEVTVVTTPQYSWQQSLWKYTLQISRLENQNLDVRAIVNRDQHKGLLIFRDPSNHNIKGIELFPLFPKTTSVTSDPIKIPAIENVKQVVWEEGSNFVLFITKDSMFTVDITEPNKFNTILSRSDLQVEDMTQALWSATPNFVYVLVQDKDIVDSWQVLQYQYDGKLLQKTSYTILKNPVSEDGTIVADIYAKVPVGEPQKFVYKDDRGFLLYTDIAVYWHDLDDECFFTLSTTKNLVGEQFSPDVHLLFYIAGDEYKVTRFAKEDENPVISLGSTTIAREADREMSDVSWLDDMHLIWQVSDLGVLEVYDLLSQQVFGFTIPKLEVDTEVNNNQSIQLVRYVVSDDARKVMAVYRINDRYFSTILRIR